MKKLSLSLCIFTLVTFFLCTQKAAAQAYVFGSGSLGISNYDNLDNVVASFSTAQNHRLTAMKTLVGYEFGIGKYGERTMMEAKWASIGRRLDSNVPGNPIENVSIDYSYNYFSYGFGLRPFKKPYFTLGGALNLGQISLRHSFGGDWIVSNEDYMASTDLFVDYAFPLKLKKRRNPYLFRIRTYYQQMFGTTSLRNLGANLNEVPPASVTNSDQNLNHFGVRASIIIPLRKDAPLKRKKVAVQ
jgi:hypothetical protein